MIATAGLNPTSAELFAALSERSDVNRRIYHVLVARFRTKFAPGKDRNELFSVDMSGTF